MVRILEKTVRWRRIRKYIGRTEANIDDLGKILRVIILGTEISWKVSVNFFEEQNRLISQYR